jgi:diguanylate cyclase (GGDEF)-like protein
MDLKFLYRLSTPRELPPTAVLAISVLAMVVVVILDLISPADIRLHVLYIFPLAAIATHCERTSMVLGGLVLSVAFQLINFVVQDFPPAPFLTDALIAFASSILTIVLARSARKNYLATATLATTDSLTGLNNRRNFESVIDMKIVRQKRYGGVFSMAIADLDDFKGLNDSQGHHAGDLALKLTANVLREHVRVSDSVARLGGDEFAILMPTATEMDCGLACQLIAAMIARRMADAVFTGTVSIGYTTFEQAPESTAYALQKADKAMYVAKAEKKSRAVSH